jgi:hypothetical protein
MLHCCLRSVYRYKTVHIFLTHVPVSQNFTEHKICVMSCSANLSMNLLISKNNSDRYYHTCTSVLMYSTGYFCQVLINAEFSRHILASYLKQFSLKLFQWLKSCFMRTQNGGRTHFHKDANCPFSH